MAKILNQIISHAGKNAKSLGTFGDEERKVWRYKKDCLKVGLYIHPYHEWELDVTPERLYQFAETYRQMKANGVDVEVPLDHSYSAADNIGYVVDMFVEPDEQGVTTLYAIIEVASEQANSIIQNNRNVSVRIEHDFKDGKGTSYGEAISHVSVVQQPVMPGQGDFIAIAASRSSGAENIPVFTLSNLKGNKDMNEFIKKLSKLLGLDLGEELNDKNADAVLSKIEDGVKAATEKQETLEASLKEAKANKPATEPQIAPNLAEQMGVTAEQQLSLLVERGNITPATRDKLCSTLIGKSRQRNIKSLSIGTGGTPSVFTQVLEALKENKAVPLGTSTGSQNFSRQAATGGDATSNEEDKEVTDAMLSAINVK